MYDPPHGDRDLDAQAEEPDENGYRRLDARGYSFRARRPQPKAVQAIAAASRSKMGTESRLDHLVLFVRHNVHPDDFEVLLHDLMMGTANESVFSDVVRAVCVYDTARPTVPSSRCA